MRKPPPHKQPGQAKGPRTINGPEIMDVRACARVFFKDSLCTVYSKVSRGLLPHRRLGGRIIFIRSELVDFFSRLPGVSVDEAIENIEARKS